ncbi:MAG TPA: SprT family zinc-dependent metalloprotease [bacterium]
MRKQEPVAAGALRWPEAVWDGGDRPVRYAVRASLRAKHASLSVSPATGLVVTVPAGRPHEPVSLLLARYRSWILRQLGRLDHTGSARLVRWPYGRTLLVDGIEHDVRIAAARCGAVRRRDGLLVVEMRRPDIEGARALLRRWYLRLAGAVLPERVAALGTPLGLRWRRISVGSAWSRWGSCSAGGVLRFSYRIMMAPSAVREYVILHELMHLIELNHSRRFWSLVAAQCPEYRQAIGWLRTWGPSLTV